MPRSPRRPADRRQSQDTAAGDVWTGLVVVLGMAGAVLGAAMLIQGAVNLQDQSEDAVEQATADQTPPLRVLDVRARARAEGGLTIIELVTPAAGIAAADLRHIPLIIEAGDRRHLFTYASAPGDGHYTAVLVRDADGGFTLLDPVLTPGDLVELMLPLPADAPAPAAGTLIHQIQGTSTAGATTARQTLDPGRPLPATPTVDLMGPFGPAALGPTTRGHAGVLHRA